MYGLAQQIPFIIIIQPQFPCPPTFHFLQPCPCRARLAKVDNSLFLAYSYHQPPLIFLNTNIIFEKYSNMPPSILETVRNWTIFTQNLCSQDHYKECSQTKNLLKNPSKLPVRATNWYNSISIPSMLILKQALLSMTSKLI